MDTVGNVGYLLVRLFDVLLITNRPSVMPNGLHVA